MEDILGVTMPATAIVNLIMSVLVTAAWFVIGHVTGRRVAARDFAEELHSCRRRIAQLQSDRGPCTCPADAPEADEDMGDEDRIVRACGSLKRHFDAVQVLTTRWEDVGGRTHVLCWGVGNWHARLGLCHEFLARAQAEALDGADD